MRDNYKFGICEWLLPIPGPTSITLAADIGYDGVQMLDWGGRENNYPLNLLWVTECFRRVLDGKNIIIQNLQLQSLVRSGGVKCHPDTILGKMALEDIRKGSEVCRNLQIPNLQIENFFASSFTEPADIDNTAALLKEAGKITADMGVQLVYESWLDYEATMQLHVQAGESFKLCYDILNPLKYHFGDPLRELSLYDPGMFAFVHVKDAPEGYQGSVLLGTGEGLFEQCSMILKKRGFEGWIVTENYYCMDPMGREDPRVNAARDLQTLKKIFK